MALTAAQVADLVIYTTNHHSMQAMTQLPMIMQMTVTLQVWGFWPLPQRTGDLLLFSAVHEDYANGTSGEFAATSRWVKAHYR